MSTRLAGVMDAKKISDADLGAEARLHRVLIYAYRTARKRCGYDNAIKIVAALKNKWGVTLDIAELCGAQPRRGGKRTKAS